MAAYVILRINCEGEKDVLTIEVGDNESAKYRLFVLNSLKNRGIKDILNLHDERDREPERHIPQTEPPEKRLSKRPSTSEGSVPATFEATKKWTMPIRNWGQVYCSLSHCSALRSSFPLGLSGSSFILIQKAGTI